MNLQPTPAALKQVLNHSASKGRRGQCGPMLDRPPWEFNARVRLKESVDCAMYPP